MNNERLLTVFTPTYNRADLLNRCYESLCSQTSSNFKWLIVDDGSTDDTERLVNEWKNNENNFTISYYYKDNGGLHTAYNEGIRLADTELFVCIDSDDFMPDDAVEKIENIWQNISEKGYVGIMGIDRFEDGGCVGGEFPSGVYEMFLYEKLTKYKIPGDKKMIHRTDLLKKVAPMPVYDNEKFFNPSYMMYQLDSFGKLYVTNECFCIVNYQSDGMSSNFFLQLKNSPKSFAQTRKLYLSFPNTSFLFKLKHSIHYISNCFTAKSICKGLKESPNIIYSILAFIPGFLLYLLINLKTRKR